MLSHFDATLNTEELYSQRLNDESNASAELDYSIDGGQKEVFKNAIYDQCDFKSDVEIVNNELENDRY